MAVHRETHFGVIETIEANQRGGKPKSNRLADALKSGVPIIVVTIQTFPFAMEGIITAQPLKARNFAVTITRNGKPLALGRDDEKHHSVLALKRNTQSTNGTPLQTVTPSLLYLVFSVSLP